MLGSNAVECVAFCTFTERKLLPYSTSYNVNRILDIGNFIYNASAYYSQSILALDELPIQVSYDGIRFKLCMGDIQHAMLSDITTLEVNLTNMFANYKHVLYVISGYCIAIKYVSGKYYIFDSHKCDERGAVHSEGKACVIELKDFHMMVVYLFKMYNNKQNLQYDMLPLNVITEVELSRNPQHILCEMRPLPVLYSGNDASGRNVNG